MIRFSELNYKFSYEFTKFIFTKMPLIPTYNDVAINYVLQFKFGNWIKVKDSFQKYTH